MIESKSKVIGGKNYTVPQLPTFEALDTFEALSKVLGPGIAALSSAGLEGNLEPVAVAVFSRLGGGELRKLAMMLLKGVTVSLPAKNGEMAEMQVLQILATQYAGKLFELFQVIAFAAEVNFADFFDGVRTLLAKRAPQAAEADLASSFPNA